MVELLARWKVSSMMVLHPPAACALAGNSKKNKPAINAQDTKAANAL
jgi:hypothetical protein